MLTLTPDQAQIVRDAHQPVPALDAQRHQEYVILSKDLYDRVRRILEPEEVDPSFYECEEPKRDS